jgi:Flp pilus assembly protein CpaB
MVRLIIKDLTMSKYIVAYRKNILFQEENPICTQSIESDLPITQTDLNKFELTTLQQLIGVGERAVAIHVVGITRVAQLI